jgi:hypothetical protein
VVLALVAGVLIGGAAVAAVFAFGGRSDDAKPRPVAQPTEEEQWPSVDRDGAEQTLSYLDGDGAMVMVVHRAAQSLGSAPTREECTAAGVALDREAPADQVQIAIAGIPDEPLRTVMGGELVSIGYTLTRCVGGEVEGDAAPLPEVTALVQERLDQLEAAR